MNDALTRAFSLSNGSSSRIGGCFGGLLLLVLLPAARGDDFPAPYDSEKDLSARISAEEALKRITLPKGFRATLYAAEPQVQNPIALALDPRGRLWIAENYTYAERTQRFDLNLRDRVVIFEDRNGDGRADARQVFTDQVQMLTSLAVGHGGVWLMCPPQLLFVPDRNGDDVPDGPPEVVLDGFRVAPENYHNFANGLKWGPDGWLYGRCGGSCPGELGAPGTPPEKRILLRGGIWRYHPTRRVVEALTYGTTNPWGHDWDSHGELFFINTVNGHLWHMIPGAHFIRPFTLDPNPHNYEQIDHHADHWHFDTGKGWTASRDGAANALGGGHAHIGAIIYQGDNWPESYRGKLLTINLHGRRINVERLERQGSGYVARHEPDFALFGDSWFRGLDLACDLDGGVFVVDWSDTGECHENTGVHRTSGRIFKIVSGASPHLAGGRRDLSRRSAAELAGLHRHANEEVVRQARGVLRDRHLAGGDVSDALGPLREQLGEMNASSSSRLRALWTLGILGDLDESRLQSLLNDADEHMRVWALRLLTDTWPIDLGSGQRPARAEIHLRPEQLDALVRLAREDQSGLVRLTLASTLQRLPVARRAPLAAALLSRSEDAQDHNLPLLVWYGLTPLAEIDPDALLKLATDCSWPTTRRLIARRFTEEIATRPAYLNALLRLAADRPGPFRSDVLAGMSEALAGWRQAPRPEAWEILQRSAEADPMLQVRVRSLSVVFGVGRALDEVKQLALDEKADLMGRKQAVQTLVDARVPELRTICEKLLGTRYLNAVAVQGLALESDPEIGERLIRSYRAFVVEDRSQVLSVLVTRVPWARSLLDALAEGRIPRGDLSAFQARQIRNLGDPDLNRRLTTVWGELRESPAEKRALVDRLRMELTPTTLRQADPALGRTVFNTACAACHTLYGEGGRRGPDLTGAQRHDLDYLLENIVDPSATVPADYRVSVVQIRDGRVLTGILAGRTDRIVTLLTQTETLNLDRSEIEEERLLPQSLMPDDLLRSLTPDQVRALFAYLMSREQVPLPPTASTRSADPATEVNQP